MKILSLHAKFSSFFSVCFRELIEKYDVTMKLVCSKPEANAPFSEAIYVNSKVRSWQYREDLGLDGIRNLIKEFQPDAILASGWMFKEYLKACREYRETGGLVIAFSDTQFQGRLKQRLGTLLSPWVLKPSIDVICVAGERQRQYAGMLGYKGDRVWEPMLCCDWKRFSDARLPIRERRKDFLYVGRMVISKGVGDLLDAYSLYCARVTNPWNLRCVGGGELSERAKKEPGVSYEGFVQPSDLPPVMAKAGAFVFPGRFEPWGVALQEAAAVGLPLISTDAAGASVHLLRDGWNGYLAQAGHPESLADAMVRMHHCDEEKLELMGDRSYQLSLQYTPEHWAAQIFEGIQRWQNDRGSPSTDN